jgi:hypothetical protein
MFGFYTAADAEAAFNSLTFVPQNVGQLQIQDVPGGQQIVAGTPAPAQSVGNTVTINLSYNWYDLSQNLAVDQTTGTNTIFNYLGAINQALGTNMTTPQMSALLLLHEFEHTPSGGNAPQETPANWQQYNFDIYNNCIK